MQAIIMAAGKGQRLGELTGGLPKSFAVIKGHRLIDYNLEMLASFGITDVVIVTGYQDDAFAVIAKGRPGVRLVFNPFYEQANVISSFWTGMDLLSDDFVYLHADTLCAPSLFAEMLEADGDVVLPVDMGAYNEEAMGVRMADGVVTEISKSIALDEAAGEFIGMARIGSVVLPALREATIQVLRDKDFSAYFEAALQQVIDRGGFEFTVLPVNGRFWAEIDFPEDYERACAQIDDDLVDLMP